MDKALTLSAEILEIIEMDFYREPRWFAATVTIAGTVPRYQV